jgi:transposase
MGLAADYSSRPVRQLQPESLIAFLEDLRRELRGKKVILVWDGLSAHKSRAVQDYLLQQRDWLTVQRLPGYAPDLNPVETLWGNIKDRNWPNRCAEDLEERDAAVHSGMARVEDSHRSRPPSAAPLRQRASWPY